MSSIYPRISITDELGRISISEEIDSSLLINQNVPLSLSTNHSFHINAQPIPSKPSIVRGIGKCNVQEECYSDTSRELEIPFGQEVATQDLVSILQNVIPTPYLLFDNNVIALPNGLQVEVKLMKTNLRLRRVSGDQSDYDHLCQHLASTLS